MAGSLIVFHLKDVPDAQKSFFNIDNIDTDIKLGGADIQARDLPSNSPWAFPNTLQY